ncbi:MAG TPA: rhomboid family intramembrane serine protease [Xanthomonadaceae bacterium]|jgi:membrane associated rhomboid family serine protease|nr:rhomboid family intramembrane serine protease [Xanthomonadaceae bacterium]
MAVSVTVLLILATVVVSWLAFDRPRLMDRLLLWPPAIARRHEYDRLITHGFVHADLQHLLFNMITLYFFGRLVEGVFVRYIGHLGFLAFYLSALVVAILPTWLRHRHDPNYRSLGASGAVSAVLFAFILMQPWALIFVFFLPVPAVLYAAFYIGYSIWSQRQGTDNVNHSAHLWGAGYGVLFALMVEPRLGPAFLARLLNPTF